MKTALKIVTVVALAAAVVGTITFANAAAAERPAKTSADTTVKVAAPAPDPYIPNSVVGEAVAKQASVMLTGCFRTLPDTHGASLDPQDVKNCLNQTAKQYSFAESEEKGFNAWVFKSGGGDEATRNWRVWHGGSNPNPYELNGQPPLTGCFIYDDHIIGGGTGEYCNGVKL